MLEELYKAAEKKIEPKDDHRSECIEDLRRIFIKQYLDNVNPIKEEFSGVVHTKPEKEIVEMWMNFKEKYDEKTLNLIGIQYLIVEEKRLYNTSSYTYYDVVFLYENNSWSKVSHLIDEINFEIEERRKSLEDFVKKFVKDILPKNYEKAYFSEDGNTIILEIITELPKINLETLKAKIKDSLEKLVKITSVKVEDNKVILEFSH